MTDTQKLQAIAMNLSRMGNWVAEGFSPRKSKITTFLRQTTFLLDDFPRNELPIKFLKVYQAVKEELETQPKNEYQLADNLLTWGTILNHHANHLKVS